MLKITPYEKVFPVYKSMETPRFQEDYKEFLRRGIRREELFVEELHRKPKGKQQKKSSSQRSYASYNQFGRLEEDELRGSFDKRG